MMTIVWMRTANDLTWDAATPFADLWIGLDPENSKGATDMRVFAAVRTKHGFVIEREVNFSDVQAAKAWAIAAYQRLLVEAIVSVHNYNNDLATELQKGAN